MTRLRVIPLALLALMLLPRPDPVRPVAVEPARGDVEARMAAVRDEADKPEPEPAGPVPEPVVEGQYRVTVYTPYCDGGVWGYQTATGASSEHLATCAVDPDVIPLGSLVKVNGLELMAVDTGSAVKGEVIDVFWDGDIGSAQEWLLTFGTQHDAEVVQP